MNMDKMLSEQQAAASVGRSDLKFEVRYVQLSIAIAVNVVAFMDM
jgi:hypothetical protein